MSADTAPVTIASDQAAPWGIALDATHVYWTAILDGTVCRAPRAGGETEVLARGQGGPRGLAVTRDAVFWLSACSGEVMRCPREGGPATRLATSPKGAWALAVDDRGLYWTVTGAVMRAPLEGGEAEVLARDDAWNPRAIAVDRGEVFWTNHQYGRAGILKARTDGSCHALLATCVGGTRALAVVGEQIIWAVSKGSVQAVPRDGGEVTTLYRGHGHSKALAADERGVFWADADAGAIRRVNLDGSGAGVLAWKQHGPRGIAVEGSEVFWADATFGRILKAAAR